MIGSHLFSVTLVVLASYGVDIILLLFSSHVQEMKTYGVVNK